MITLKKGTKKIADIYEEVQVRETPDGLVFEARDDFFVRYTDNNLPQSTKLQLRIMLDRLQSKDKDLVVDFLNYNRPISVKM